MEYFEIESAELLNLTKIKQFRLTRNINNEYFSNLYYIYDGHEGSLCTSSIYSVYFIYITGPFLIVSPHFLKTNVRFSNTAVNAHFSKVSVHLSLITEPNKINEIDAHFLSIGAQSWKHQLHSSLISHCTLLKFPLRTSEVPHCAFLKSHTVHF